MEEEIKMNGYTFLSEQFETLGEINCKTFAKQLFWIHFLCVLNIIIIVSRI